MSETFYWHDYETFGTDPSRDRAVQFAGLRTDKDLNVIGEPLVIYSKPARDVLPQPMACLITGISPQKALEAGLPENEFIRLIHEQFTVPGTCGVGYNSLRFDDEVTRYTLYRNFYDPYGREWQNGNSRWDIIDLLRTAYALRPEGINWPKREDGLPSFRLEELTAANGIGHESAHDALSDVHATIAMARLVKEKQPKLYDYVVNSKDKRSVLAQLDIRAMKPILHVSGMFGAARHSIALVVPLAMHPDNKNEVICYDLSVDPQSLLDLSAAQIQDLLYTKTEDFPEGVQRPGLKSIHINKCPVIVPAKMATPEIAQRLDINGQACRAHLAALREYKEVDKAAFNEKIQAVYTGRKFPTQTDPDRMLYSGGFFSNSDRRTMDRLLNSSADDLASTTFPFEDVRLPEMLFRYRARNFPESLSPEESAQWEEYRFAYLTDPEMGASICMEQYQEEIESLLGGDDLSDAKRVLLEQLLEYGDSLLG
ncbi:MAG: exodeoxyribonuclease I [Proteobacteria bacterium]|nr:exodeoxyribonuclease I [Pseudomonadota bacterium]